MRISDWSSDVCSSDLKFLKPPVKFAAPLFEPFAGCGWQTESRHDRLRLGFAEQVAVEPAVSCRSLHPDIPGTQLVAQMRDRRDFPETPVDLAVIAHDDFPPFLAEGPRSVGRQIGFARPVEVAQHPVGGDRFCTGLSGPELERLKQVGSELDR